MPAPQESTNPVVLLVDDSHDERDMYTQQLVATGYSVQVADNGEDALERVAAQVPDVVVMDLAMPVLDGWEATRRIKADWSTRDIPVIALSAYGTVEARQLALSVGCDDAMVKPVDPQLLHRRLRAYAAQKPGTPGCSPSHH